MLLFGPWAAACMTALGGSADWTLPVALAGGIWAGCLLTRHDEEPVRGVPTARGGAGVALVLIALHHLTYGLWPGTGPIAALCVSFTAAAACAGWCSARDSDAEPRWVAVAAVVGGAFSTRPLSDEWAAAPIVVAGVALVAVGGLALGRARRTSACIAVIAVASLTVPRGLSVDWWSPSVNAMGPVSRRLYGDYSDRVSHFWEVVPQGVDVVGYLTGAAVLLLVFELSWRDLAPRSRVADLDPVADRVAVLVMRRVWSPVITLALIAGLMLVCFDFPGLLGLGRHAPLLLNLMAGIPLLMVAALYHVTVNGHGMLVRSAAYGVLSLVLFPAIAVTALAASPWWAWFVVMGAVFLAGWSLVSGELLRWQGLGQRWGPGRTVLLALALLSFALPWGREPLLRPWPGLWLPLLAPAFHCVVLSRVPARTILRWAWGAGCAVAVLAVVVGLWGGDGDRMERYVVSVGFPLLLPPVLFTIAVAAIACRALTGRCLVIRDRFGEDVAH